MLYPEQNEARLKLSLDGTWAFALGSCVEDQFDPAKPLPDAQPIAVPASYNDQNDQTTALRRHYGWAWYQRKVTLPTFCAGQRVVLRFGSVTHTAKVWLNGQLIAQHKGGFTPFEADVTALLRPGETVLLTVACDNRVNHSTCLWATRTDNWPSLARTTRASPAWKPPSAPPHPRTARTLISSTMRASTARWCSTPPQKSISRM